MNSIERIEARLDDIRQWIRDQVPMLTIARRIDVPITTLHRYVHRNGLARSKEEAAAIRSATTKAQWAEGRRAVKKPYREPMTPKSPVEPASDQMAIGELRKDCAKARNGSDLLLAAQIAAGIVWRPGR